MKSDFLKLKATVITISLAFATHSAVFAANEQTVVTESKTNQAKTNEEPSVLFKKHDSNKDSYIDREEAKNINVFSKAFDDADENRDGKLDEAEFTKARAIYDRLRAKNYVEDSVITAKVKAALIRNRDVKARDVQVETFKGVVQLSGFVDSEENAKRAAEIASGIGGVESVKNDLMVKK